MHQTAKSARGSIKPVDAILLLSFGGPGGMDEVRPYLENIWRGKNVPRGRIEEVVHHYEQFGGISPINEQNLAVIDALRCELDDTGICLPIYFGNRNWHPLLIDTVRQMAMDGVERALTFVTSAYSSYSGCRQYLENLEEACRVVGDAAPVFDKLRVFYNHPRFIEANVDHVKEAWVSLPDFVRDQAILLGTAHSIPLAMAETCCYESQLEETVCLIGEGADINQMDLVYQSRSGPPEQPWLGPDVCDFLEGLPGKGISAVVLAPIGFLSDHMEVLFDLDREARDLCNEVGLSMVRAKTVGTHPAYIRMIRELIQERIMGEPQDRVVMGRHASSHDVCPRECCSYAPAGSTS